MSLILDAIKKSERERQQQGVPDLGANHGDYQGEPSERNWWPIIIITVLVLLLAGVYFSDFKDYSSADKKVLAEPVILEEKQPQIIKVVPLVENKSELPLKQPEQIIPEQAKETLQQKRVEIKKVVVPEIKPLQTAPVTVEGDILNLNKIPASLQRELPKIQFSSHIFTGDQATSFVVLNDEMLGVGEALSDEIEIIQINKQGLVIEFDDQKIFLEALQNWQP